MVYIAVATSVIATILAGYALIDLLKYIIKEHEQIEDLKRRIASLEADKAKRQPFGTTDVIMDALAQINYTIFEHEAAAAHVEQAKKMLFKLMDDNKKK